MPLVSVQVNNISVRLTRTISIYLSICLWTHGSMLYSCICFLFFIYLPHLPVRVSIYVLTYPIYLFVSLSMYLLTPSTCSCIYLCTYLPYLPVRVSIYVLTYPIYLFVYLSMYLLTPSTCSCIYLCTYLTHLPVRVFIYVLTPSSSYIYLCTYLTHLPVRVSISWPIYLAGCLPIYLHIFHQSIVRFVWSCVLLLPGRVKCGTLDHCLLFVPAISWQNKTKQIKIKKRIKKTKQKTKQKKTRN